MKILNILVFGILITTNAHAGGVYGTLYDSSDLLTPKGEFEEEEDKNKRISDAKKEKEQRAEQEEAQRKVDQAFQEKINKLRR